MKAALLSVGTEILFGQITNTNTVYLSQKLNSMGIDVMYHFTDGDNPGRLAEMIEISFRDCDIVITTGGLGPTQDDLTKETACSVMGDSLVMHKDILESIEKRVLSYRTVMTDNNRKQAEMPSRCRVFYNDAGTAPGFALDRVNPQCPEKKQWIACMPGPPSEMMRMFEKSVMPWLEELSEGALYYRELRTFGIGESALETSLLPVIDGQTDPTVATYAKTGECSVRIASKRKTREEAKEAVEEMINRVMELVGDYVYSTHGEDYPSMVGRLLIERGITVSCAESCTGGKFAAALTDISGISQVFDRGIVTYSNAAKIQELGVKSETLAEHGAVSEETAKEMAVGIRRVSGSYIGISVTGIAGPDGGTDEKPVGLVYIGLAWGDEVICRKISRNIKDRDGNRTNAMLSMFDMIYRNILC